MKIVFTCICVMLFSINLLASNRHRLGIEFNLLDGIMLNLGLGKLALSVSFASASESANYNLTHTTKQLGTRLSYHFKGFGTSGLYLSAGAGTGSQAVELAYLGEAYSGTQKYNYGMLVGGQHWFWGMLSARFGIGYGMYSFKDQTSAGRILTTAGSGATASVRTAGLEDGIALDVGLGLSF